MLKMLLDPMGGIVVTNDGHAILREIDVTHPAAKSLLEVSRAQDESVGDGTTSVIVLSGEMLGVTEPLLERRIHPTQIVQSYMKVLDDINGILDDLAIPINVEDEKEVARIVRTSIDTKFVSRWGSMISDLAIEAAGVVKTKLPNGQYEIDMKRYAKIEKVPGGSLADSQVLDGVMFNKDVTHGRMRREIRNPRILLLDCPLEYKKGESQTNVELTKESDFAAILRQEEEEVSRMCRDIIAVRPDLVITEKGVSDLAQHFLMKANISCIRRVRKTDNNRIARVSGATIVNRTEEINESHVGTRCKLFKVSKLGDEYYTFLTECEEPKACTVLLRGASKDVLNEIERNLQDAFCVARNVFLDARLLPGGGATEMALSAILNKRARAQEATVREYPYKAAASALEVIPRTLAQNAGADVIRVMTALRSKHALGEHNFGIDGNTGKVVDVREAQIFDSLVVKQQIYRAAIESSAMMLRIDDIVSGVSSKKQGGDSGPVREEDGGRDQETFGDSRDG
jgi:T-complex protein 1 subunit gamma